MNIKIIISPFLFIITHNSFCMIIDAKKKKQVCTIYKQQEISTEKFLKLEIENNAIKMDSEFPHLAQFFISSFHERSLEQNFAIFTNPKIKYAIPHKIESLNNNPNNLTFLTLMEFPQDLHIETLSRFFEEENKQISREAANHFYTMPLQKAIKKYSDNESSWLIKKNKLSNTILFLLTDYEKEIIKKIYQGKTISKNDFFYLINQTNLHVRGELYRQQLKVNLSTGVNQFKTLIYTPYQTITNMPVPIWIINMQISKGITALVYGIWISNQIIQTPLNPINIDLSLMPHIRVLTNTLTISFFTQLIPTMLTNFHNETIKTITLG